jgi:hypothetical protein
MELLGKYYEEGDCLSKAMAEMLLKSLNKDIKDFRVSPSFAKGRELKDTAFTDREFLKKTAIDSVVQSRTDTSNIAKSSISKLVFDRTPEIEVKPFNDGAYISQAEGLEDHSKDRRSVSFRNMRRSNDNAALVIQSNQSERSKDESSNRNLQTSEMSFTNKIQLPHLAGLKRRRGRPPLAKLAI